MEYILRVMHLVHKPFGYRTHKNGSALLTAIQWQCFPGLQSQQRSTDQPLRLCSISFFNYEADFVLVFA